MVHRRAEQQQKLLLLLTGLGGILNGPYWSNDQKEVIPQLFSTPTLLLCNVATIGWLWLTARGNSKLGTT
jgi:hypothetical protein